MSEKVPIALSYRPKSQDYLPVVVAAIRRHLGDWPIALLTEARHHPPARWLRENEIHTITDWEHSPAANKVLRLWEHQQIFARHFDRWIWWHDDMLILRPLADPVAEFQRPLARHGPRPRPNRELGNWDCWLWDTLGFFSCQGIAAPNPVLHIPRLIDRLTLLAIPAAWDRRALLFEPTYLLWHWHHRGLVHRVQRDYRTAVFRGEMPAIEELEASGSAFLTWGRKIDHPSARNSFGRLYPLDFESRSSAGTHDLPNIEE